MKPTHRYLSHIKLIAFVAFALSFITSESNCANVTSRTQRKSVAGSVAATGQNISSPQVTNEPTPVETVTNQDIEETSEYTTTEYTEPETVENKSSQFDDILGETIDSGTSGEPETELARKIREQRAAADLAAQQTQTTQKVKSSLSAGKNECDQKLRSCMQGKCGTDFTKCSGDTDTTFGDKLDACRRDITCTGEEYRLFTTEIKADMELNAKFALYNSIVDCGNNYNSCIVTECGPKFTKCLAKKKGDAAVQKCSKIAEKCRQHDSGLPSRMMEVFGTLRLDAEQQVSNDEKRLYELRDKMRDACGRMGALFDDRTLDCVYSINFFAGEKDTQYASKKAYAGTTFDCTPNWFGIDITTFMENAQRLTRAQTSATNALMGSGMGMAVGSITSGAMDRAIDSHKADKALKKAEKEHKKESYTEEKTKKTLKDKRQEKKQTKDQKKDCEKKGGKWVNNECKAQNTSVTTDEPKNDKKTKVGTKLDEKQSKKANSAKTQKECATIPGYRWDGSNCVERKDTDDRAAKCALKPGYKYDKETGKCEKKETT